ncbi:hypothetical protein Tsp_04827 [Trichinella spiralis]|uniref:Uncharacterized protein n=1 Tax=Trichinella spiralis TaxID=6334 RepID=E5SW84_TRISP|nr:hypothetical protein Tsp_04827 [Trichinella spiralis]KRY40443.1 hypothetical protein T01_15215 [Trichinella spiralis]
MKSKSKSRKRLTDIFRSSQFQRQHPEAYASLRWNQDDVSALLSDRRCIRINHLLSSSNADYELEVQRLKERFKRPYTVVRKETLVLRRSPVSNGQRRNSLIPSTATSML